MVSTRGRLLVLGGNPLHGSDALDSRMGACLWDLYLDKYTGDGRFDGGSFLGRLLIFFSWGDRGGDEEPPGHVLLSHFSEDDARFQTAPFFMLYIIY